MRQQLPLTLHQNKRKNTTAKIADYNKDVRDAAFMARDLASGNI